MDNFNNTNENSKEQNVFEENTTVNASDSQPSQPNTAENAFEAATPVEKVEAAEPIKADADEALYAEVTATETTSAEANTASVKEQATLSGGVPFPENNERKENVSQSFGGAVSYTKSNPDGNVSSCCEWNSQNNGNFTNEKADKKHTKNNGGKKQGKGFKIFIASVLSVFTVSLVVLTAMCAVMVVPAFLKNASIEMEANRIHFSNKIASEAENGDAAESAPKAPSSSYPKAPSDADSEPIASTFVAFDREESDGKTLTIPEIAAKCSPSTVGIISEIEITNSYPYFFYSSPSSSTTIATGSGFIFTEDGYVITNHHVIEDAIKVTVVLYDKTELEAEIVGSDSLSDVAVLKVTPPEDVQLIPMEIGNSRELVVGESVVAIGCPAGIEFLGTVTDGIISAINRDVEITNNSGSAKKTMTLIQTNATINHGNSGGPLINTKGQVIGINTLKLTADYEGIGFSIPINGALQIIEQLIEHGKVVERTEEDFAYTQGMIGITGSEITEREAEEYEIPRGVMVVQITKNCSAAKAGLTRGDIITHYNGEEVYTVADINALKGNARAGEEATVTVYRSTTDGKGQSIDITFTLDSIE